MNSRHGCLAGSITMDGSNQVNSEYGTPDRLNGDRCASGTTQHRECQTWSLAGSIIMDGSNQVNSEYGTPDRVNGDRCASGTTQHRERQTRMSGRKHHRGRFKSS